MSTDPVGARIPIAVAALVRDGRVLLVHRHPARAAYPSCWDLVGGHVEAGESAREAVARECLEELGVHVHDPVPLPMTVADPALEMHAFVVTRWDGEPVNAAPDEHDDLGWFRPDDLDALTLAHAGLRSSLLHVLGVGVGDAAPTRRSEKDPAHLSCPDHPVRGEDDSTHERNPRCAP